MASLFGRHALEERARTIDTSDILGHVSLIQTWLDDPDLLKDKETSREQAYNQDFFVTILGYRQKPFSPYTFEPKHTTEKKQFPDAVLRFTDPASGVDNVSAVVELKGAKVALDKPQQREGNLSPVQQAFKYKPQYRSCPFVVVSNFVEFRLYNDNQLDFEVWTLSDLVDPADDYLEFKKWFVLLRAESMVSATAKAPTERLLSDIRQKQLDIGKQFYVQYKYIREELLRDIWSNNSDLRSHFETGIKKAQTIIDRFMFVCFAEDTGLLPDNTLARVVSYAQSTPYGNLWDTVCDFFDSIETGSRRLGIPNGYDGGLFMKDEQINQLVITDKPLLLLAGLGKYNFQEDLTVNILGHLFEQSVSDLEVIKARVRATVATSTEPDFNSGKRKKDGIFYTPDYIVRHIVNNSLGGYLGEKEDELKKKYNLAGMRTDAGYEKRERQAYTDYQQLLQNIKVLDPACGSGAFLVYVYDYLLSENKRVADILQDNTFYSSDLYARQILTDNLYGVDLNEESVEITKLSLWLKTAEKNKSLQGLDSTIRTGNSLISDPTVEPDAMDWEKTFPEVMDQGGFDVIVGNPPYVQLSQGGIDEKIRTHLLNRYQTSGGRLNTYIFFTLLALELLSEDGRMGFIVPNTLLTQDYYKEARKLILEGSTIEQIVEYPDMPFEDATVENISLLLSKKSVPGKKPLYFDVISQTAQNAMPVRSLDQRTYHKAKFNVFSLRGDVVTDAIDALAKTTTFADHYNINQAIALKGDRKASIVDSPSPDGEYYKLLDGRNISQYHVEWSGNWLEYDVSRIHSCKRKDIFLADEKLFFRRTGVSIIAAYDDQQFFALNTLIVVTPRDETAPLSLKALLVVLNSSVLNHYYGRKFKSTKTVFSEIQARSVGALPLPAKISDFNDTLEDLAVDIMDCHERRIKRYAAFSRFVSATFALDDQVVGNALQRDDWKAIDKVLPASVSMAKRGETFEYFQSAVLEVETLSTALAALKAQADEAVAKAYELSDEHAALTKRDD